MIVFGVNLMTDFATRGFLSIHAECLFLEERFRRAFHESAYYPELTDEQLGLGHIWHVPEDYHHAEKALWSHFTETQHCPSNKHFT